MKLRVLQLDQNLWLCRYDSKNKFYIAVEKKANHVNDVEKYPVSLEYLKYSKGYEMAVKSQIAELHPIHGYILTNTGIALMNLLQ